MKYKLFAVTALMSLLFLSTLMPSVTPSAISIGPAIGVHTFNDLNADILVSEGSFSVNNNEDTTIIVRISTQTNIKSQDLDRETGEPRTHTVNKTVVFHEQPKDWITFEQTSITIPPNEKGTVDYTLRIPIKDLPSYVSKEDGFLSYITVQAEEEETNAAVSISERYDFKVFTIFGANLPSRKTLVPFNPFIYIVLISLSLSLLITYVNQKYHLFRKIKQRALRQ